MRADRFSIALADAAGREIDRRLRAGRWASGRELTVADAERIAEIGRRIRAALGLA
jgi:glutathione S-transferase